MNTFARLSSFSLTLMSGLFFLSARANDTSVSLDMGARQIKFYGVYSPDPAGKRGGLDAEIVARRNGIASLQAKLHASCHKDAGGAANKTLSTPPWQGSVKSLGSEIYANGVLKIALVAPLRDVFKEAQQKPFSLKSSSGTPLSLKLPTLTLQHVQCGLFQLAVGGKTIPLHVLSGSSDASAKPVKLALDGTRLKPASAADAELLASSNLFGGSSSSDSASSQTADPAESAPAPAPAPSENAKAPVTPTAPAAN
ncbi:MAG: hypothetical protein RIR26_1879 [Pseudomonadota bacterium]|jgi:hypothetical protein